MIKASRATSNGQGKREWNHLLPAAAVEYGGDGYGMEITDSGKIPLREDRSEPLDVRGALELAERPDAAMIGIYPKGFIVLDFDSVAALREWEAAHPTLARELPGYLTSRGAHKWSGNDEITGKVSTEFGEIIAGKNYALCPPSRDRAGFRAWLKHYRGGIPTATTEDIVGRAGAERIRRKLGLIPDIQPVSCYKQCNLSVDDLLPELLPAGYGQRSASLFKLARAVKFDLGMKDASAEQLQEIVRQWHARALPFIRTKDFRTSWDDFRYSFKSAKVPLNVKAPQIAYQRVLRGEVAPNHREIRGDTKRMAAGICWNMSGKGTREFFLSSYDLAQFVKLTQQGAFKLLKELQRERVIELVERGNYRQRIANCYKWRLSSAPIKTPSGDYTACNNQPSKSTLHVTTNGAELTLDSPLRDVLGGIRIEDSAK